MASGSWGGPGFLQQIAGGRALPASAWGTTPHPNPLPRDSSTVIFTIGADTGHRSTKTPRPAPQQGDHALPPSTFRILLAPNDASACSRKPGAVTLSRSRL